MTRVCPDSFPKRKESRCLSGWRDGGERERQPAMKAITNTLRDGVTAVATAPLVGGALRYAAVIANFGTLSIGFKAVVEKSKGLPREEAEALILAFCEKHRDAPLRACLNMGGFYIKVGQLLSGMPALPRPWAESLRSLQTDVPPRELARIVELIERDFGCSLEAVGLRDFSATPLGAASIGQVHSATLGGRRVVVKVMYPEAPSHGANIACSFGRAGPRVTWRAHVSFRYAGRALLSHGLSADHRPRRRRQQGAGRAARAAAGAL
jgi:hypothetical protein